MCNVCAKCVQIICTICATFVQRLCKVCAKDVQSLCKVCAHPKVVQCLCKMVINMQSLCKVCATCQRLCKVCAKFVQRVCILCARLLPTLLNVGHVIYKKRCRNMCQHPIIVAVSHKVYDCSQGRPTRASAIVQYVAHYSHPYSAPCDRHTSAQIVFVFAIHQQRHCFLHALPFNLHRRRLTVPAGCREAHASPLIHTYYDRYDVLRTTRGGGGR